MSQIPPEYIAIGRIVTMLEECVAARGDCGFEPWPDGPNPYYNQTSTGLFLQLSYGLPSLLWTPWGGQLIRGSAWTFGTSADDIVAAMLPRLGAELYREGLEIFGDIGAIYSLSKVDDLQLPAAVMRDPGDYVGYDEIKRAWQDVVQAAGSEVSS